MQVPLVGSQILNSASRRRPVSLAGRPIEPEHNVFWAWVDREAGPCQSASAASLTSHRSWPTWLVCLADPHRRLELDMRRLALALLVAAASSAGAVACSS